MPGPAHTAGSALPRWGSQALTGLSRGHTIFPGGRQGAEITPCWLTEEGGGLETHSHPGESWCPEGKGADPTLVAGFGDPLPRQSLWPRQGLLRSLTARPLSRPGLLGHGHLGAGGAGSRRGSPGRGQALPLGLSDKAEAPSPWSHRATQGTEPSGPQW